MLGPTNSFTVDAHFPETSRLGILNHQKVEEIKAAIRKLLALIALKGGVFFWRRDRDSNPGYPVKGTPLFESGTFNHSDISPEHLL